MRGVIMALVMRVSEDTVTEFPGLLGAFVARFPYITPKKKNIKMYLCKSILMHNLFEMIEILIIKQSVSLNKYQFDS